MDRTEFDFDCLEGFNIGEFTPMPGLAGAVRLSRFPSRLESGYLMPYGKLSSRQSTGCELRLVPAGQSVVFRVSSPNNARIHGYQGDFWRDVLDLESGKLHEFQMDIDPRISNLPNSALTGCRYDTNLVRLVVQSGTVLLHSIDGFGSSYQRPEPSSSPMVRWLAYGSSITQADFYGYVFAAAERLGIDVLNKGLSGSCGIEQETVEFLVENCEWDFMTCEWGINVVHTLEPSDFKLRVSKALDIILARNKPVFLITVFPNSCDLDKQEPEMANRLNDYNSILRAQVLDHNNPNLKLIEGSDILTSSSWLSGDLLHPTHLGQGRMGENLARILDKELRLNEGPRP